VRFFVGIGRGQSNACSGLLLFRIACKTRRDWAYAILASLPSYSENHSVLKLYSCVTRRCRPPRWCLATSTRKVGIDVVLPQQQPYYFFMPFCYRNHQWCAAIYVLVIGVWVDIISLQQQPYNTAVSFPRCPL
jgi:hypothetical protein